MNILSELSAAMIDLNDKSRIIDSMKRFWLLPLIVIGVPVLLLLLGANPLILNLVRAKIETSIRDELGLPVRIRSLKGNLFFVLEAERINVDDVVSIDRLMISYNVLKLIKQELEVRSLALTGLDLDIDRLGRLTQGLKGPATKPTATGKGFTIRIAELLVTRSRLSGIINDQTITTRVNLQGELDPDRLIIDRLTINSDGSEILVWGEIPLNDTRFFDLRYRFDLAAEDAKQPSLTGVVTGMGIVLGDLHKPRLVNQTAFEISYKENRVSGRMALEWATPSIVDLGVKLEARISTPGKDRGREDWTLTVDKKDQSFSLQVSSSFGIISGRGTVSGDIADPRFAAELDGQIDYARFRPRIRGRVSYTDQGWGFRGLEITSQALRLELDGSISNRPPRAVNGEISIAGHDLGLLNIFLPSPQPIAGRVRSSITIRGSLDNPVLSGRIRLEDAELFRQRINRADLSVDYLNRTYYLRECTIVSPRGEINLSGHYRPTDNSFAGHLHTDRLILQTPEILGRDSIPIQGTVGLDIRLSGGIADPRGEGIVTLHNLVYDQIVLGDYLLEFRVQDHALELNLDNRQKGIVAQSRISLEDPFRFQGELFIEHLDLTPYVNADTGYITGQVSIRGRADQSLINGRARIDTLYLVMADKRLKNCETVLIDINDQLLEIGSCIFAIGDDSLYLTGNLPLDPVRTAEFRCRSSRIDLATFKTIFPALPLDKGFFDIDCRLEGRLSEPQVNGFIKFEDMRYATADILVDSTSGVIRFKNRSITLSAVRGKVNGGPFTVDGFVNLDRGGIDTLLATVSFKGVKIRHKDFGQAILSSDLAVKSKSDSFEIRGEVVVDQGVYDVPFNLPTMINLLTRVNRPMPEQDRIIKQTRCQVGVSAPQGIMIRNNIADLDIDLDLQVQGYLSRLNVYGTVHTRQEGTIKYLGKRFEITEASLEFDNPYKIDPVLSLEATYQTSGSDGDYEIFLQLSGTVEKWRLGLTSLPELPEPDIISLLLIGRRRPGTDLISPSAGLEGTARDYALGFVRGTVERRAERTLGLERFSITGNLVDPRHLDIGIEKRLGERLTVVYGTGIESWELRKIGFNYDLTDNLSIYTLHDQENLNSSIDLDYHFELK